jgi:hypothetical protein
VRPLEKVPTLAALLLLAFGAGACGGDAESAGDLESTPFAEESLDDPDPDPVAGEPGADPAEVTPPVVPPSAAAPAPRRPATAAPPAAGTPPAPPAAAPDPAPAPDPEPALVGPMLPEATRITGVLEDSLSTRHSQVGDVFHARIEEGLRAADGTVLLPAGSRLEGRVAESRESPSAEEPAALLLEIVGLVVDGQRFPIRATVVETELATETRDSAQRSVATVATGAAAGAVIGRILGRDTRSTVAGAAAGAVAGAGIALTNRDGHASLAQGARITIRLDDAVILATP